MVSVYHNKEFINDSFTKPQVFLKENLTRVAEIDTKDLETAYNLTNHTDSNWTQNEGVTPLIPNPRSTSEGDILEKDNKFFVVNMSGFDEI